MISAGYKLYSQNPELAAKPVHMDDHQFWKQADRKKLLEQMHKISGTTVMVPVVSVSTVLTAEALPRGVCRKKSVCEKNAAMIFIVFSDILPFTGKKSIQIPKVSTIFPISMVWNIMAISH